jgi:quercetin dioxygenase-like cupin family protein
MSHHNGREFQLVLAGEMLLELGFERYRLKAGDSIIFDSTTPHRLSNAGQEPMRAISVIFNTR